MTSGRVNPDKSSSEIAKGLFLLGQKGPESAYFQKYYQLMMRCAKEGEFLSFKSHTEYLACYAKDAQFLHSRIPLLVFRPHVVANIAPFIQVCHDLDIPVAVRGGGTGLAGGCVPSKEGVVLLTGHFKSIKAYDKLNGTVCVEPGVTIRQLNRHIAEDFWHFPLSMATNGVASIAGCLSTNARGYHQQSRAVFEGVEQVLLIDGQGQILEVPGAMVCGAEGLWGVIIELKICLKKKNSQRFEFISEMTWSHIVNHLPKLRSLHVLTELKWTNNRFFLAIEGEEWRLSSAITELEQILPGLLKKKSSENSAKSFLATRRFFVALSSGFQFQKLPEACDFALEQVRDMFLECLIEVDVLAGSLHLILQSQDSLQVFQENVKRFLVVWSCFVDDNQGVLVSCHGVGMQMSPYMPPFWSEESQRFWRSVQSTFDPKSLFGRERFFPIQGNSLEKIRSNERCESN